jgi:4a-hydroxytetrahydrobiopterin dehydratase
MPDLLDDHALHSAMADRPHWEVRRGSLFRAVQAPSFMDGIRIVDQVAQAAEELDHHPDIDIRWTTISFALSTHSEGGITDLDVTLAARIDEIIDSTPQAAT